MGSDRPLGTTQTPFEPRRPTLMATGLLSVWIALLSLPMLAGNFIAAPYNDQYSTGYAFREWAAQQWKTLGHIPLWNPEIYAGMPFVAGMHGDIFYPTALLRLVLPIHVAMNLGFVLHYVLAGLFTYWFLRLWKVSWTGAVCGGVAYQLSGVIGSYVSPGHDGKLFVTALLPLAFVALTLAIRHRRFEGYALFALSVGLALLSPHPQMAQYFLLAAAIFAVYLTVDQQPPMSMAKWLSPLALSLGAVIAGVLVAAIQYLPFYAYIPFSPRAEAVMDDFAFSASYAIPWEHVPELLLARFVGESFNGTYWATNGVKFHSEYLGLPVVALAALGLFDRGRRRLAYWLGGAGVLFLLVALGGETPFYRLWWSVVPFVKSTRAPGMALFVVAFVIAVFAAFGIDRFLERPGGRLPTGWMSGGAAILGLSLLGVIGIVAESLAQGVQASTGRASVDAAVRGAAAIRWGAASSGLALLAVGALGWGWQQKRLPALAVSLLLFGVVGADLWLNARSFWNYSRAHEELFAPDEVKVYLGSQQRPYRVWNLVYPQSSLMADDIAQWYGHHGNELHTFDLVNGREGIALTFASEGHPRLRELYAIEFIIVPAEMAPESIPGFEPVLSDVSTSTGRSAVLFQSREPVPYFRLVPAAVEVSLEQAVATVVDPRLDFDRIVLIDSAAAIDVGPIPQNLPDPLADIEIEVLEWRPGAMRVAFSGGSPQDAYLVVSENYYKDWKATVDGEEAAVVLANGSLLAVPVAAGAREVALEFTSDEYRIGKMATAAALFLVLTGLVVPPVLRRRRRG